MDLQKCHLYLEITRLLIKMNSVLMGYALPPFAITQVSPPSNVRLQNLQFSGHTLDTTEFMQIPPFYCTHPILYCTCSVCILVDSIISFTKIYLRVQEPLVVSFLFPILPLSISMTLLCCFCLFVRFFSKLNIKFLEYT